MGAVNIHAKLDCDAFASAHSSTSHYDRQSFVGLAWRPENESCCCEVYSTGRANLPGSTRERDLVTSFARMVPQLLAYSDRKDVLDLIPEKLKDAHKPRHHSGPHTAPRATMTSGASGKEPIHDLFNDMLPPLTADSGNDDALYATNEEYEELLRLVGS